MNTNQFTNELCITPEQKEEAYRIRYASYNAVGYAEGENQRFADAYDEQPNHFTFLLKKNGVSVGTMRASVLCPPLNWNTLPCKAGFEAEIAQLLGEYDAVIEMGRLAVLKDFADLQMQAPIMLFANAFIPASMFENVAVVCCSSKAHMRFYQRMGMKKMCEVLPRPNAAVDLTLMAHRWDHECFLKEVHISTLEAKALMAKIPAALKDQLFPPFVAALQPA